MHSGGDSSSLDMLRGKKNIYTAHMYPLKNRKIPKPFQNKTKDSFAIPVHSHTSPATSTAAFFRTAAPAAAAVAAAAAEPRGGTVLLVLTAPGNFARRDAIRRTGGGWKVKGFKVLMIDLISGSE